MADASAKSPATAKGAGHIPALDGMRGIAALTVLVGHTFWALSLPDSLRTALVRSPFAILINGQGAVQIPSHDRGVGVVQRQHETPPAADLLRNIARPTFGM
jgi:hypothetical protein